MQRVCAPACGEWRMAGVLRCMRTALSLTLQSLSKASSAGSKLKSTDFIWRNHGFQTLHGASIVAGLTRRRTNSTSATLTSPTAHIPRSLLISFFMLAFMLTMAALDQTKISTALPVIARDLHGAGRSSWVFSACLIA